MPKSKISEVKTFIKEALAYGKYPQTIICDEDDGYIVIHLLNQHNKNKAKETIKMLEDYANLKPRKDNDRTSNRQRFLQALKRSPYISILPQSTKDLKYIYIKEKGEARPGNPEQGPTAGPSTITETDARNVPQMTNGKLMEFPTTPVMYEDEQMECTSTSPETHSDPLVSSLLDFEEGMDFTLPGSENLIHRGVELPGKSCMELLNQILNSELAPDSSNPQETDAAEEDFLIDYNPTEDLLRNLKILPKQDVEENTISSSENQLCENTNQRVTSTETGFTGLDVPLNNLCNVDISDIYADLFDTCDETLSSKLYQTRQS